MEKIDKSTRVKLLAILLLSNICIYLLTPNGEASYQGGQSQSMQRKQDYITLKIMASLKTNFEVNRPISISNSKQTFLIPYAVLLQSSSNQNQNIADIALGKSTADIKELTIYVHKKYTNLLLAKKDLLVLPHHSNIKVVTGRRRNYEVTY